MIFRKTMSALAFSTLLAFSAAPVQAADQYSIDPAHVYAGFQINHLGFSTLHGRFNKVSGTIVFDEDSIENSKINVVIDSNSIDTNHQKRDGHLKSPDFFNAMEFAEITFDSISVRKTAQNSGEVTGTLTMLGVQKPITLAVTFNKAGPNPFDNSVQVVGFSATATIKRSDFGMKYGAPAIGDDVTLVIEAEGFRK